MPECYPFNAMVRVGDEPSVAMFISFNDDDACAGQALDLGCITNLNVTLNENCQRRITPQMVVTGNVECADQVIITIDGEATDMVSGCGDHTYSAEVIEGGVSVYTCWGNIFAEDKTAPVADCPADVSSITTNALVYPLTGDLSAGDDMINLNNHSCYSDLFNPLPGDHPYDVINFTVTTTDIYTFDVNSTFGDAALAIYQGGYDVNNPCENIIGQNQDAFANTGNAFDPRLRFSLPLIGGQTYQLFVTNWAPGDLGAYTVNVFADGNGAVSGITAVPDQQEFDLLCDDVDFIAMSAPRYWVVNAQHRPYR